MVIVDNYDRKILILALEIATQLHNLKWKTQFITGKLSLKVGAICKLNIYFNKNVTSYAHRIVILTTLIIL